MTRFRFGGSTLLGVAGVMTLALSLVSAPVHGQERAEGQSRWRDPLDGRVDLSAHLATAAGFLPILSPITEPALDYGLAGVVAFLHRPKGWTLEEARASFERGERQRPPSVSALAGGYTLNDSWFVGGGHLGIWRDDRLRYTGFGGYGAFNLSVVGEVPQAGPVTAEYSLRGWFVLQALQWRLGDSPWLVGVRGTLAGTEVSTSDDPLLGPEPLMQEARNGSLGATLSYDSRDNIFSPNRGIRGSLEGRRYDDAFLGDYDYWEGSASVVAFTPLGPGVLGLRGKGMQSGENVPFWALPGVGMRGVPARQYAGSSLLQGEAEYRWDLDGRWSLVGFGGVGWTENAVGEADRSRTVAAGGVGGRYLLARAFGVRGGVDLAWGPDGAAFYITVGSALR